MEITQEVTLIEPTPIHDIYCDGVASMERKGGNVRFILYTDERPFGDAGAIERRVVAKIVGPVDGLPSVMTVLRMFLGQLAEEAGKLTRRTLQS